jgi:hypothetical protein
MGSTLDKKFTRLWQSLKTSSGVKSSSWFKKADAAVSKKIEAYQSALAAAHSGLVEDLLKLAKALQELEEAFVKFVDAKELGQISDDVKKAEKDAFVVEINRFKADVQHERSAFESRLRSALSAADNDLKKLESIEANKKKELWKGFGINL